MVSYCSKAGTVFAVATPFYVPTSSARGFQLLHTLASARYLLFSVVLSYSHPSGRDEVSHRDLDLHLPDDV